MSKRNVPKEVNSAIRTVEVIGLVLVTKLLSADVASWFAGMECGQQEDWSQASPVES